MIIDASVACKWIFIEEGSGAASALLGRGNLRAPTLLLIEVANALWKKGMRGELHDRDAFPAQIGLVASLVAMVDEPGLAVRALDVALQLAHPIYDCVYLALAERENDVLVSADERFLRKVAGSSLARYVEALA